MSIQGKLALAFLLLGTITAYPVEGDTEGRQLYGAGTAGGGDGGAGGGGNHNFQFRRDINGGRNNKEARNERKDRISQAKAKKALKAQQKQQDGDEWSGDGTDEPTEWAGDWYDRSGDKWNGDGNDEPIESPIGNKCKQVERDTCCNQPNEWSQDKKTYICEKMGCNLKKCDKREIDSGSSSSWSGDEHDPTEPPTLSPVESIWSSDGFEQRIGNENEYQAPCQGDIRSPCPAINTLANHGFVNRNGTDIDSGSHSRVFRS